MIRVLGLVYGHTETHTFRVLAVLDELKKLGDFEIKVSGTGRCMEYVKQQGYDVIETRGVTEQQLYDNEFKDGIFGFYSKDVVDDMYEAEQTWLEFKPDIIIRDTLREVAGIVAKEHGIYDVLIEQFNISDYYHYDFVPINMERFMGKTADKATLRKMEQVMRKSFYENIVKKIKEVGLPVNEEVAGAIEPDLVLFPDSELLFPVEERMGEQYHFVGPLVKSARDVPPEWIEEYANSSKKRILISGGTTKQSNFAMLCKEALDPEKYCIAICNPNSEDFPDFYSGRFKLSSVLPYTDLFIHHGGISSTFLGIQNGVPMFIIYSTLELQINAMQTQKIGVGKSCSQHEVTADIIRETVDAMLSDKKISKKAKVIASMHADNNAEEKAARLIYEGYQKRVKK